ncbi:GNAT family N-acetyltransferase [Mycobacteroides abscessus]|jgi:RimJ/RimL family protein N-acetyltransferase|uniref:Acetyltransferase n=1 Tax=Mycobacteroides abscessus subsp. bolletii TaxID=319705 RepID=A0A9Q7SGW1_9MYCO|nr:GNAT family N-acetyltransferase [Mycobacteroides abscessus]AMU19605.1 acetyltransferase [Mycobacteroides abscessus]MDO2969538.1 GNAT family N-acetyltransferase [Mycobacteroides abscessus subsp. bolletii]MDO3068412.1 GNAT family N-acetyltransferase [Mycobacteroides abscessus subsp. bolletii]MDO3079542.1 GNAT family N-acetyltransferase [Mycobacteroides abscessus subsp. bolletii]MDO3335432.1 GNAT family N-acetyltransferase [Mycobacteroides abscessus subsp. bolletii]
MTVRAERIDAGAVVLRKACDADRDGLIEIMTDREVRAYLGGPRPRADVERFLGERGAHAATAAAGAFIVADSSNNRFAGTVTLDRRHSKLPGHVSADGDELELSYVFRRDSWGRGWAYAAAAALIGAAAAELPDQPVLVATQRANVRSVNLLRRLGFEPISTFVQFDAEQILASASLHSLVRA